MNPNECLQLYTALKLHFSTPKYDFYKYQGKVKNPPDFRKRKDKQFFSWLAQKPDPEGMLIANISKNPKLWIGDLFQEQAKDVYLDWKKRQESLSYLFKIEFEKLIDNFPEAFKVIDGQHPQALKLYMQNEVSLETMTILNELLGFIKNWDIKLENDPVWKSLRLPIIKYSPFLDFDRKQYGQIILNILQNNA